MPVTDKVADMTREETEELISYVTRAVPYDLRWWKNSNITITPDTYMSNAVLPPSD